MNELIADVVELISRQKKRKFWNRLFQRRQLSLSRSFADGDIWTEKLGKQNYYRVPRVIYFYYLKFNPDDTLVAEEYRYYNKVNVSTPDPEPDKPDDDKKYLPIEYNDVPNKVIDLVHNARSTKNNPPPHRVGDFQDLTWKRRCYFVIFFDEDNWKLYHHKDSTQKEKSPVIFLTRKNYKGKLGNANHTFYDARFINMTIKNKDGQDEDRSYFSFINHMKEDGSGQSEVSTGQYFCFNVLMEVYFEDKTNPPLLVIFDPGGTNDGPPIDP